MRKRERSRRATRAPAGNATRRPSHARARGDAYAYCKTRHPGAIQPRWTRELVLDAMRAWQERYGRPPSSYDWSPTHARRRGPDAIARLQAADWPTPATVTELFGIWAQARTETAR